MEQFKTISTFDLKGPIRKEDHLRASPGSDQGLAGAD